MARSSNAVSRAAVLEVSSSPASPALGPYGLKKLLAAGLLDIIESVQARIPLTRKEAETLVTLPFSQLAALSQLQPHSGKSARLQALLYTDLAEKLEHFGSSHAQETSILERAALARLHWPEKSVTLSVLIDSWSGKWPELLSLIKKLSASGLVVLGPSTGELKKLVQAKRTSDAHESNEEDILLQEVLSELLHAGVKHLEGGSDLRILKKAAELGLSFVYTHNLVRCRLPISQSAPSLEDARPFLDEIFRVRAELLPTARLETWSLWSSWPLDSSLPAADAPLGLEVLRSLLLAKLLLPEVPFVRCPLSLVGIRLTEVAGELGLSDFGFVAADTDSARRLGMLSWSAVCGEFQCEHELSTLAPREVRETVVYENG